jgi:curli biogenesis system outer membrane secretion channel CsgG
MSTIHTGRRWSGVLVAATLATAATFHTARAQAAPDTRPTLAVMYFTNSALVDFASYAPLSKGMSEILISEIAQNSAVRVVERDRLQALLEEQNLQNSDRVDKETASRLGKTLGARHMLMGSFIIQQDKTMRIDVRAVNTETSAIEYTESVTGKADKLLDLVIQLGAKVNAGLKLPALKVASATIPAAKSPNQFKALMAMSQALEAEDKKNVVEATALYKSALALNPDFDRAKVRLASIERISR